MAFNNKLTNPQYDTAMVHFKRNAPKECMKLAIFGPFTSHNDEYHGTGGTITFLQQADAKPSAEDLKGRLAEAIRAAGRKDVTPEHIRLISSGSGSRVKVHDSSKWHNVSSQSWVLEDPEEREAHVKEIELSIQREKKR